VKDAVLVRDPWRIAEHRLIRFDGSRRWYPRGCLIAGLAAPGRERLWAISVHLGLDGPERAAHARRLVTIVDHLEPAAPVVLGGDLNARPDAGSVRTIAARLPDAAGGTGAPTFPAGAPTARIDHVFASADLRRVATATGAPGAETASDHLPVTAELDVAAADGPPRHPGP
jgi:endonuclease/exonuclease/phosphatase family metal-dependent hydrolase